MLSRLRKIEGLTVKITQEMPITYNIETDFLYEKGIEKEKLRKDTLMVEKFLLESRLNITRIAEFVEVTEAFVLSIQERLIQEGIIKRKIRKGK